MCIQTTHNPTKYLATLGYSNQIRFDDKCEDIWTDAIHL